MDNAEDENLWTTSDTNHQFYGNQYQPMQQQGFDLQREMHHQQQQPATAPTVPTENMLENMFLYDNHGPYLKIYFHENNVNSMSNDYELFDRNQHDISHVGRENFLPNAQPPLPFNGQPPQSKNPSIIHHLVSSLGPNKTGSYSPFGETIANNSSIAPTSPSSFINVPAPRPQIFSHENLTRAPHESSNASAPTPASNTVSPAVSVKKTRIVAEVKPMRMSYSDVVSKNPNINGQEMTSPTAGSTNSASSSPNTTLPVNSKSSKPEKVKFFEKRNQEGDISHAKAKKSPINTSLSSAADGKRAPAKLLSSQNQSAATKKRHETAKESSTGKNASNHNGNLRNSRNKHTSDSDDDDEDDNLSSVDSDDDVPMEFYNVRKNVYHGEHHNIEKIITTKGLTSYKKVKNTSAGLSKKTEKIQKRTIKTTSRKRQKHEVLLKLCLAWGEYFLKFLQWLWTLVYDVINLSCGIILDRMSWCIQCAVQGFESIRRELGGSPGKAAWLWMKNQWKIFDGKFEKKSRWAFWRWLFKKKQQAEQVKDYYKDGKLPKTAEEAMKSLLNCKGKDAYSILGVSPNCSQEQIRKHYKKIAVLVHPDKNKQAGAEEAFKVLQRSFELIGEPESRQQYDQSMAEALHAEKAFTELNDLLVQLQTKISEAANTIRCSSCCFRHPRKPTGRKPFAARECSSCKIRHPAREGDIWAETTCFGFRWKYLALMEGNVYDITQWALCQRGALSHLQANSCVVQYKIVLGGNSGNQQNQSNDKDKLKKGETPAGEPSMDDFFLNNIYAGQNPQQQQNSRRRFKKN